MRRALTCFALLLAASICLPAEAQDFPRSWYFPNTPQSLRGIEGKPAPTIQLGRSYGQSIDPESMRGKVIVVDFWATWCGPCVAAIPKNVKIAEKYRDKGVVVLGIHDARRGHDRIPAVMRQMNVNYPVAVDDGGVSARAWRVAFWPTYAVVDQKGIVRGAGLNPQYIEAAVQRVLREAGGATADAGDDAGGGDNIPRHWLETSRKGRDHLEPLLAAPKAPDLTPATNWMNSEGSLDLARLEGKVVLLDFWATWCRPCIRSIPKLNELQAKYGKDGLVIIGICHPRGGERMAEIVEGMGIEYTVCLDPDGTLIRQYGVNGYPDYHLIDRTGKLVIADCANASVEDAIKYMLAR